MPQGLASKKYIVYAIHKENILIKKESLGKQIMLIM